MKVSKAFAKHFVTGISREVIHALVQGEFSLTVALLRKLQDKGITCLAATTERVASDDAEGRSTRTYKFVRFREYPAPR